MKKHPHKETVAESEPKDDGHVVKSAMELALERAAQLEEEPITLETENGSVSVTFEELKAKALAADELRNQLLYKQAEFENYRKRTLREREELLMETVPVSDLLEILDALDRARASRGEAESILAGVELIRAQLWGLLQRKGVEPVPGVGESFDPNHHEAIAHQAHEAAPAGTVLAEYQPGFKIGDRVIRPTKVVVSAGPYNQERADAER
ncbi:MAG: Protein GrpE [bacterium]|nr:Protein GrpE [bacterium]